MSSNREEILANFQECTGIENVEEAIMWLESAEWDLLTAVNSAIPQDAHMQMYDGMNNSNENIPIPVSISNDFLKLPSTSKPQKILNIEVNFQGKTYKYQVPDSMTVGCVKTLVYADTCIPPCKQELSGWDHSSVPKISDDVPLHACGLSDLTRLSLNAQGSSSCNQDDMDIDIEPEREQKRSLPEAGDQVSRPSGSKSRRSGKSKLRKDGENSEKMVSLKIHDGNQNKEHNLTVPASQTVRDIKNDIVNLTGISLSEQTWLGWPDNAADAMKLSELVLDQPSHHLTVVRLQEETRSTRSRTRQNKVRSTSSPDPSDSGAETDSFEDASESFSVEDEMFNEEATVSNRITPLMPDNVEDETVGSVSFIDGYTLRYGQTSPNFFSGPLENAINEAFLKTGREKKMLAIYLHHDGSILTNVFCSQLLGSESILQLFATYFVVWGWDVTNRRNRELLLNSVLVNLGQNVTETISNIKYDEYPALLIISKLRSNVELLNVIRGNIGANELLNMLVNTIDIFSERLEQEIQNEEERAARDQIKFEQDMAYQESLILDKAKEESRKQQEILQLQEEERLKQEEEQRAAEKLAIESQLPEEPSDDISSKEIMTFRFRTPKGDFFIRKFRITDTLQTVFDFLLVKGFRVDEFKVISPFPRKDLSALDGTSILKDVGLCAQETLTLEER